MKMKINILGLIVGILLFGLILCEGEGSAQENPFSKTAEECANKDRSKRTTDENIDIYIKLLREGSLNSEDFKWLVKGQYELEEMRKLAKKKYSYTITSDENVKYYRLSKTYEVKLIFNEKEYQGLRKYRFRHFKNINKPYPTMSEILKYYIERNIIYKEKNEN